MFLIALSILPSALPQSKIQLTDPNPKGMFSWDVTRTPSLDPGPQSTSCSHGKFPVAWDRFTQLPREAVFRNGQVTIAEERATKHPNTRTYWKTDVSGLPESSSYAWKPQFFLLFFLYFSLPSFLWGCLKKIVQSWALDRKVSTFFLTKAVLASCFPPRMLPKHVFRKCFLLQPSHCISVGDLEMVRVRQSGPWSSWDYLTQNCFFLYINKNTLL